MSGPAGKPRLRTRLNLRPLLQNDADLYCQLYTDPETMHFIGAPLSRAQALRRFRQVLQRLHSDHPVPELFYAVVEQASAQAVGICSIQRFDARQRHVEAGIILTAPARARGYSKEAYAGAVALAFQRLPVDEVRAQIAPHHRAARGLLINVGFSRVCKADPDHTAHRWCLWSIDRGSWCKRR